MVPTNRRYPPLEGGQSTKIGGMWTLKHDIRSPKFYALLITIHTSKFKIPKEGNTIDTKYDEQFLIIQSTIEANEQEAAEKKIKNDKKLTQLT